MILYEDTRQKKEKHNNVLKFCRENGITLVQKCLQIGDYMFPDGDIAVDTKANIGELAADLYKDRKAYGKKYKKGVKAKIRLVVLIEEPLANLNDIVTWQSKHSNIKGRYLLTLIDEARYCYNINFYFCNKEQTGEMIINLLEGKNGKQ